MLLQRCGAEKKTHFPIPGKRLNAETPPGCGKRVRLNAETPPRRGRREWLNAETPPRCGRRKRLTAEALPRYTITDSRAS